MRVLHVVKGLGPGGAERLLVSLAAARTPGVEFDVAYVLPQKDHLVGALASTGVQVHLLSGSRGLADVRWPAHLLNVVRARRPDIVHLHSPAVAGVARPLLRLTRDRPALVSSEHNVWGAFGRATRVVNALTLPLDDLRLAVSEEVRSSAWSPWQRRTHVLVQGVPVADLRARRSERMQARASLELGDDDVLVVTVANFREKKDYPTLLAAAKASLDEPRLQFVAIGQGPLAEALHALHQDLGLGERFRFLGYHPDPPAVLAAADIFTLTSRHEGLPISLLEAMALGVPPVVSAVGGIPEAVDDEDHGLLLAAGDSAAFADAFRRLAADPARRLELGDAAARRAADFDISRTQRELEALYARLIESR